jgi:hypothetical protein
MTERHDGARSDPQEHLLAFLSDGGSYGLSGAEVEGSPPMPRMCSWSAGARTR